MNDDPQEADAAAPRREKKPWEMRPRDRLEWMRRQRESHRFPVRPRHDDDDASRDDEYDPYR